MKVLPIILILTLTLLGCSSSKKTEKNIKNDTSVKKEVKDTRYKNNPLVSAYDVNHDGIADMWKVYKDIKFKGKDKRILERREIDLNFDGKVNYFKFYTESAKLKKEYLDFNLDGVVDSIRYYEKNQVTKEDHYDSNPISKNLELKKDAKVKKRVLYSNQRLTRIIIDRTGDGYLDKYLFFKKNELVQIGFDDDNDGKIDTRVRLNKEEIKKDKSKNDK